MLEQGTAARVQGLGVQALGVLYGFFFFFGWGEGGGGGVGSSFLLWLMAFAAPGTSERCCSYERGFLPRDLEP